MATQPPAYVPDWRQPVAVAAACAVLGLLILAVVRGAVPAPVAMIGLGAATRWARPCCCPGRPTLPRSRSPGEWYWRGSRWSRSCRSWSSRSTSPTPSRHRWSARTSRAPPGSCSPARPRCRSWERGCSPAEASERPGRRTGSPRRAASISRFSSSPPLYGVLLALLGRISLIDGLLLVALYVFYVRRIRRNSGRAAGRRRRVRRPRGSAAAATTEMAGGPAGTVGGRRRGGRRRSLHRRAPANRYVARDQSLPPRPVDRARRDRDARVRGRDGARAQSPARPRSGRLPRCLRGPVDARPRRTPMGSTGGRRRIEPTAGHPGDGGGGC